MKRLLKSLTTWKNQKVFHTKNNCRLRCWFINVEDDILVDYMISDTIWAKAKVNKEVNTVNLWLGANTMVEYTLEEAKNLLSKNLVNAKGNLKTYVIIV